MNFFQRHFPTTLSKVVVFLCVFLLVLLFSHSQHEQYRRSGESLMTVAEYAVIYQGVRHGMNAVFSHHRDNYHERYH